jgi:hypothetical protein
MHSAVRVTVIIAMVEVKLVYASIGVLTFHRSSPLERHELP